MVGATFAIRIWASISLLDMSSDQKTNHVIPVARLLEASFMNSPASMKDVIGEESQGQGRSLSATNLKIVAQPAKNPLENNFLKLPVNQERWDGDRRSP